MREIKLCKWNVEVYLLLYLKCPSKTDDEVSLLNLRLFLSQVAQPADEPAPAGPVSDEPMEHWGGTSVNFPFWEGGGHKPRPTWHLLQLTRITDRGERCCCDVPLSKLFIQNILCKHQEPWCCFCMSKVYHYTSNKLFFWIVPPLFII